MKDSLMAHIFAWNKYFQPCVAWDVKRTILYYTTYVHITFIGYNWQWKSLFVYSSSNMVTAEPCMCIRASSFLPSWNPGYCLQTTPTGFLITDMCSISTNKQNFQFAQLHKYQMVSHCVTVMRQYLNKRSVCCFIYYHACSKRSWLHLNAQCH